MDSAPVTQFLGTIDRQDDLTAVAIVELESEVRLELWGDVAGDGYPELDSHCLSTDGSY